MNNEISNNTTVTIPIAEYDRLRGLSKVQNTHVAESNKKYVYGLNGIRELFNCSIATANRIKASGKIDKAITQIGKKIIVDSELAMELARQKNGGRK